MKTTKKKNPVNERESEKKMPSKDEPKREIKRDDSTTEEKPKADKEQKHERSDTEKRQQEMQNAGKDEAKTVELDDDIRNDILQTGVNPNVQKRGPIKQHEITPEERRGQDLNQDERIVNNQEDALDEDKYKDV